MEAFVFDRIGEPSEVLERRTVPDPEPGPGEVLVRVILSPVHPPDLHLMRGRFARRPPLPTSPGMECVGVVETLGPGVEGLDVGTRVVLIDVWGSWAERIVAPAARTVPVPRGISDEDAAQAIQSPVTAWILAMLEHRMQPGEWLAQTAAGSTVGRLVLQIARHRGFRTINLVRRPEQTTEIEALGGDVVLCTEDADWPQRFSEAADGAAPTKAIDCVAGRVGATVAGHLAPGGRLIVYGALSSHRKTEPEAFELPIFAPRLIYAATTVQGWLLFHWLDARPLEERRAVVGTVLGHLASGVMRLPPAIRYRPEEIGAALETAEAGGRVGKPLLDFSA